MKITVEKVYLAVCAAIIAGTTLFANSAHAANGITGSAKVGQWQLKAGGGTGKILGLYDTLDACAAAGGVRAKATTDSLLCRNDAAVILLAPPPPFSKIADEGGAFTIAAPAGQGFTVRYGTGSTWIARDLAAGSYTCDNATFTDPMVGTVKHCEQSAATVPVPVPPPPNVPSPPVVHMHGGVQGILVDNPIVASADGLGLMPGIDTQLTCGGLQSHTENGHAVCGNGFEPDPAPSALPPSRAPEDWEQGGDMRTTCKAALINNDDSLVFPLQPGLAHTHTQFSPQGTASTTDANIRQAGNRSTCRGGTLDLTQRWVPTAYDKASMRAIVPHMLLMYYKTGNCVYSILCSGSAALLTPLPMIGVNWVPEKFHIIAGDPAATAPNGVAQFTCIDPATGTGTSQGTIPKCAVGTSLWMQVHLPNCLAVDANGLPITDSPNHKDHAAYMVSWPDYVSPTPGKAFACPASHPYEITQIDFKVIYDVLPGMDTSQWGLSCTTPGSPEGPCMHADWRDGWKRDGDGVVADVMGETAKACLQGRRDCGTFRIYDGRNAIEFDGN